MKTVRFPVYEIEHSGDLEAATAAIVAAGGKVIETRPNYERESAAFVVEIPADIALRDFLRKVEQDSNVCCDLW